MKIENIEIEKITKIFNNKTYYLFFIPKDNDMISCYMQEKDNSVMIHCIGLKKEDKSFFLSLIDNRFEEWVEDYKKIVKKLEQ